MAELLSRSDYDPQHDPARQQKVKISQERLTWGEIRRCIKTWVVSSIIGTVVGAHTRHRRRHSGLYQL
ncbi:MAG: hypothetical protein ACLUS6_04425 [Dysosmobacter sp.]